MYYNFVATYNIIRISNNANKKHTIGQVRGAMDKIDVDFDLMLKGVELRKVAKGEGYQEVVKGVAVVAIIIIVLMIICVSYCDCIYDYDYDYGDIYEHRIIIVIVRTYH